jgi:fused signal recognition particle receptor
MANPQDVKKGWFSRLRDGLQRSKSNLSSGINEIFVKRRLDEAALQELEDLLISADLGVATAERVTGRLRRAKFEKDVSPDEVGAALVEEIEKVLEPVAQPLEVGSEHRPHIILVVGVNGTGKTTTIGKLAHQLKAQGCSVMLAAGDTFRAAAIEQLDIWGARVGVPVVRTEIGGDAAGLAFDAVDRARSEAADVLIVDTAGRLQNRQELMEELAKIIRVIRKKDESAPHDILLVLDATTGQNALRQVEVFSDMADVTGLIMTKLDGTARGGVLVACAEEFGLPVHAIGVGETVDDLHAFKARAFAEAIAGSRIKSEAT